jgi:predicted RecB family nuclease
MNVRRVSLKYAKKNWRVTCKTKNKTWTKDLVHTCQVESYCREMEQKYRATTSVEILNGMTFEQARAAEELAMATAPRIRF